MIEQPRANDVGAPNQNAGEADPLLKELAALPPIDPANNPHDRLVTFFWTKSDQDMVKNWHFYCFDLMKYLGIPVRLELLENNDDWRNHPATEGRVIIASMHHNIHEKLPHLGEANIKKPYGVLILSDEDGNFDQSIINDAALVIRPYYFENQYVDKERVIYIPTGYLYGRGPWDPSLLIPASHRKLGCWFSGSMRGERQLLQSVFTWGGNTDCRIEITAGFTQGLSPDKFAFQMQDTKLSLCPAGNSPETIRIYESWECGAIPVMTEADFNKAQFAVSHPEITILLVPNWNEAPKLIRDWLDPRNAEKLDRLQAENIAWYQKYKQDRRLAVARGIRGRL